MDTKKKNLIPPDVMADLEHAAQCAATGQLPAPEFVRRIADEADKIREEVEQKYGILDIGVPAIRELRDA
jgi:hypothetical protein